MWKNKVQIDLKYHTDPHKLFPDDGTPIPHYTRMLPINLKLSDGRSGVFNLAVHIPENSYTVSSQKRANDAFKFCTTAVSMFTEVGEAIWMNSTADIFFSTGPGSEFPLGERLKCLLNGEEVDAGSDLASLKDSVVSGGSDDAASIPLRDRQSSTISMYESAYEHMTKKVFIDGKTFTKIIKLKKPMKNLSVVPGYIHIKCTVTAGIDPISGAKVAVLCQEDVSKMMDFHSEAKHLEVLNHQKDMLFANMSHELKTPLNGIIALADILIGELEGGIDEDAMLNLQTIHVSGKRLNNLVTNLLDASLLKDKKLAVKMADDCNLFLLVSGVLKLSKAAKNDGVKLTNSIPRDFETFKMDNDRLTQMISNLVGKARKFTLKGWIDVSGEVKSTKGGDIACITVSDTGIGIDKNYHERIFEVLCQVEEVSKTNLLEVVEKTN